MGDCSLFVRLLLGLAAAPRDLEKMLAPCPDVRLVKQRPEVLGVVVSVTLDALW